MVVIHVEGVRLCASLVGAADCANAALSLKHGIVLLEGYAVSSLEAPAPLV